MWRRDEYVISTDTTLIDLDVVHGFIAYESYWGTGRSREFVRKAIDNSTYCFGVFHENGTARGQVGFARVVSDLATFGYIADLFILRDHRGKGLGKWLVQTIAEHPELSAVKRLALFTNTPEFYEGLGFSAFEQTPKSLFLTRQLQ